MTGAGDSCWFLNVISGAGNPSAVPGDCWNQWHTVSMIWCHLPEEAGKLPLGVCKLQEEDQKPITPCGRRVHRGNGSVKSLFKCK